MELFVGFDGLKFFQIWGLVASVVVVIPNFFFASSAKATRMDDLDTAPRFMCNIEFYSRMLLPIVLTAMCFPVRNDIFGIIAAAVLVLYFIAWVRFFKEGSYYPDIYMKSFLGIPVPFDMFNVLFFLLVSMWLCNLVAFVLAVMYGICRMTNAFIAKKDLNSRVQE